ncbi:hypothetical protein DLH72_01155 [Candidatus Gracilibacteria bacterium]|nr:MAG: hypothetical protein DLH72_01155 [Candidatus Gracilibacteria bacterium]
MDKIDEAKQRGLTAGKEAGYEKGYNDSKDGKAFNDSIYLNDIKIPILGGPEERAAFQYWFSLVFKEYYKKGFNREETNL